MAYESREQYSSLEVVPVTEPILMLLVMLARVVVARSDFFFGGNENFRSLNYLVLTCKYIPCSKTTIIKNCHT